MVVISEIEDEQPKLPKHLVALPVESMSLEVPRSSRMAGAGRLLKLVRSENISGFQFEFTQKRLSPHLTGWMDCAMSWQANLEP